MPSRHQLDAHIHRLSTANAHGEYYLTDMAGVFHRAGKKVVAIKTSDASEVLGSNTRAEMMMLDAWLRLAKCRELPGARRYDFLSARLRDRQRRGSGRRHRHRAVCSVAGSYEDWRGLPRSAYSVIGNSVLGDRVMVQPGTIMEDSRVGAGAVLGPYTHMRPGSDVGEGAPWELRRDEESQAGKGFEGQSPQLSGRRGNRGRRQRAGRAPSPATTTA